MVEILFADVQQLWDLHAHRTYHRRSIEQGHYTNYSRAYADGAGGADAKTNAPDEWLFFNDQRVSAAKAGDVQNAQAYLAFYQRAGECDAWSRRVFYMTDVDADRHTHT